MLEEVFAVATEKYLLIEETVRKIRIKEDEMCEKTKQNQAKINIALLEWQQASMDDVYILDWAPAPEDPSEEKQQVTNLRPLM